MENLGYTSLCTVLLVILCTNHIYDENDLISIYIHMKHNIYVYINCYVSYIYFIYVYKKMQVSGLPTPLIYVPFVSPVPNQ